jgi:predicted nucleic acid-binding protein
VQVDRLIGERARSIRRQTGMKTPDAIHLACALEHNVDHLITRDAGVLTRHGTFFRRDGKAVSILTPANALGGPLFNQGK